MTVFIRNVENDYVYVSEIQLVVHRTIMRQDQVVPSEIWLSRTTRYLLFRTPGAVHGRVGMVDHCNVMA